MALPHPDEIRTVPGVEGDAREQPTRTVRLEEGRILRLRRCHLRVLDGPEAGRALSSDAERIRIGADPGSDLPLGKDSTVSRAHCEILFTDKGYLLVDPGSTNGTFVDGRRVERAFLGLTSELRAGSTRIAFAAEDERVEVAPLEGELVPGLVAGAPAMRQLLGVVKRLAPMETPVLLEGEVGAGRDTLAHALHAMSGRSGALVAVDVAALPEETLEAELTGPEGAIVRARGGTLFLEGFDEVAYAFQPKLLRALEGELGARLIVGARRPLAARVEEGGLRADLFYRVAVLPLAVPPLRARPEDVAPLLAKALAEVGAAGRRFSPDALEALTRYAWPGNVRELFNLVNHLAATTAEETLGAQALPPRILGEAGPLAFNEHLPFKLAKEQLLERFEREYLMGVLKRCDGNLSRAARESGIHRKSIERLVKKYQLNPKALRSGG